MKDKLVEEIRKTMKKLDYKEVTKLFYHKNKNKKFNIKGCWKIENKYFYFLKQKIEGKK